MKNQQYGIHPIRMCKPEQKKLLQDKYQAVKTVLEQNRSAEVYWAHLFLNEKYYINTQEETKDLMKWIENLLLEIENGVPQYVISMGFTNNPKDNNCHQHFHFDYNLQYKGLFIPMTNLVYGNSPQFFQFALQSQPKINHQGGYQRYGQNQRQLLEQEGVDFITVSQVISKPYAILKLHAGTVHRGIRNTTGQDRMMFHVGYAEKKMVLEMEKPIDT